MWAGFKIVLELSPDKEQGVLVLPGFMKKQ